MMEVDCADIAIVCKQADGAIIKFDQKTEKFTFYPGVQRGDLPKIEITREGAVWYNPRSALKGAVGVLYPDVSKMTTFEAKY